MNIQQMGFYSEVLKRLGSEGSEEIWGYVIALLEAFISNDGIHHS